MQLLLSQYRWCCTQSLSLFLSYNYPFSLPGRPRSLFVSSVPASVSGPSKSRVHEQRTQPYPGKQNSCTIRHEPHANCNHHHGKHHFPIFTIEGSHLQTMYFPNHFPFIAQLSFPSAGHAFFRSLHLSQNSHNCQHLTTSPIPAVLGNKYHQWPSIFQGETPKTCCSQPIGPEKSRSRTAARHSHGAHPR